jgi:hypothetical protein
MLDPEHDPDPEQGPDPKISKKSDPGPQKIIPDPQHCVHPSLIFTGCDYFQLKVYHCRRLSGSSVQCNSSKIGRCPKVITFLLSPFSSNKIYFFRRFF